MKLMNNLTGYALYEYCVNSGEFEPNALDEIKDPKIKGIGVSGSFQATGSTLSGTVTISHNTKNKKTLTLQQSGDVVVADLP